MPRLTARVREMMIPDQNKGELRDQIMSICKSNYAELVRSKDDLAWFSRGDSPDSPAQTQKRCRSGKILFRSHPVDADTGGGYVIISPVRNYTESFFSKVKDR